MPKQVHGSIFIVIFKNKNIYNIPCCRKKPSHMGLRLLGQKASSFFSFFFQVHDDMVTLIAA